MKAAPQQELGQPRTIQSELSRILLAHQCAARRRAYQSLLPSLRIHPSMVLGPEFRPRRQSAAGRMETAAAEISRPAKADLRILRRPGSLHEAIPQRALHHRLAGAGALPG